jgi:HK97 family phage prohead protease
MTDQTTEIQGTVSIRQEGDAPTLDGLAVPWDGSTTRTREYPGERESFARGAFGEAIKARAGKRVPYLDEHADGTRHIVGMVDLSEADDGLRFSGPLLGNQAARDYAERVAAGADGVSVQFLPGQIRRGRGSVTHTQVGSILALAGTYAPAYAGASVALREDETVTMQRETEPVPTPDPDPVPEPAPMMRAIVRGELDAFRREIAESGIVVRQSDAGPYASLGQYKSLGALMHAAYRDTEVRDAFARALADQITSESPGVMGGANVIGEVKGIIAASRPGIDAFGASPLGGSGMSVDWPYVTVALGTIVGVQAAQKTEITSVDVPILKGTSPIATYSGGSDLAVQLIRRSDPSYLDAYGRILLAAYAFVTDKAFVDAVEATAGLGSIVIDFATATSDQIRTALFAASVAVQAATGAPASFVLASSTAFVRIGGQLNPEGQANGQTGSGRASELRPEVSGLPVIHDANVNPGTILVSNRSTASWHEDGPFQIADDDVAKLGRDIAVWGLGATAVYIPAGIIKSAAA